jgi:hypothetical protein
MSRTKDLSALGKLIAVHHGWSCAKEFKTYEMDDTARAKVSAAALDVLKVFPEMPGASALLSAAFAVRLEEILVAPIQVVAGTLSIRGEAVLGGHKPPCSGAFSNDQTWDGYAWVMVGPYIADVSLFRTAYSRSGPAMLSRHVELTFGSNKGLYVDQWSRTRRLGLEYEPSYVLSRDEVNGLMASAYHTIREHAEKL